MEKEEQGLKTVLVFTLLADSDYEQDKLLVDWRSYDLAHCKEQIRRACKDFSFLYSLSLK